MWLDASRASLIEGMSRVYPTLVNSQITDAVNQANALVLGAAPAQAVGALYQMMAHAVGLSMQNAVAQQRSMNTIATAVTTQGVNGIYGQPVAAGGRASAEMLSGNALAQAVIQLAAAVTKLAENT